MLWCRSCPRSSTWCTPGRTALAGFPLDDAWIHQTYARNLAQTGQLAYLPGQPSAGSTSPAWSFILSVAYMLKVDFYLWTYLVGCLALAATAWFTYRLFLRLGTKGKGMKAALLAGLLCAVEWHLVWASVSGMETILFTALSLALLEYYFSHIAAMCRLLLAAMAKRAGLGPQRTDHRARRRHRPAGRRAGPHPA